MTYKNTNESPKDVMLIFFKMQKNIWYCFTYIKFKIDKLNYPGELYIRDTYLGEGNHFKKQSESHSVMSDFLWPHGL